MITDVAPGTSVRVWSFKIGKITYGWFESHEEAAERLREMGLEAEIKPGIYRDETAV